MEFHLMEAPEERKRAREAANQFAVSIILENRSIMLVVEMLNGIELSRTNSPYDDEYFKELTEILASMRKAQL